MLGSPGSERISGRGCHGGGPSRGWVRTYVAGAESLRPHYLGSLAMAIRAGRGTAAPRRRAYFLANFGLAMNDETE